MKLFAHPFSSYCQKVLIAFYENDTPFEYCWLGHGDDPVDAEFRSLSPVGKFPLLVDGQRVLFEASIIIEHLGLHHPGPVELLPRDARSALEVRMIDRLFDNYAMTPMQRIVGNALRPPDASDPTGVEEARSLLDTFYAWLDRHMEGRSWAAEDQFSLADCAAAPSLFYADWVHPLTQRFPHVAAYRARLLERPSVARAVDEARPYRHLFPLGAPDRD